MQIQKEYIFTADTFFPSCHASTILPLEDGSVLAAWFGGSAEGKDDVRIWFSKKNGSQWSAPSAVPSQEAVPHWNPVLFQKQDGTVRLFYKYGKKIPEWITRYTDSSDGGESWSEPRILVPGDASGGRGPVKNKCIRTAGGTVLAPASTEQRGQWKCFIDRSEDDGDTWKKADYIVRPRDRAFGLVHMIQPTLWQDDSGVIHALMRTSKGAVYTSESSDDGIHWTKAVRTPLPNNNSGIDCVRSDDGRIWLLYNPVSENWGDRTPLHLAVSEDNGKTFATAAVLEEKNDPDEEFSYPAIVCKGSRLYMSYTWNRKRIVYCEADI